jgi:hypothetical protein
MLVEIGARGVPHDPLQFLECDPGVVARLESLGAGEALRAAGRDMEESLSARQFAAIARQADAAVRGTRLDPVTEGQEAKRAVSESVERAARSIGALDPAAGAWIRLRAATDHASNFPRPPLSAAEVESRIGPFPGEAEPEAAEQWRRRHDALVEQVRTERGRLEELAKQLEASLVGLVTSLPTPELVALGARIAPDAIAVASCLQTDACIGKGGIASLVSRAEAALRDVASAVPDPRTFAVTPAEIYRLASWQVEEWENNRIIDVEGCGCCGILVRASGGPVLAELVTVDTVAIAGFGPVDRTDFCRKLESLAAERSAIQPVKGDPVAADALRSVMARLRTVIVGQFATAAAALPPADSAPEARAAALRDWALLSHPGLRRMYDDSVAATRRAAESDADARVALMDSAIAAAMERIVSGSRSATARDGSEDLRWAVRASAAMRMAANAIEQAAATVRREATITASIGRRKRMRRRLPSPPGQRPAPPEPPAERSRVKPLLSIPASMRPSSPFGAVPMLWLPPAIEGWVAANQGIDVVLLGYVVAVVFRIAQGSATVAMQAASAVCAGMLPSLHCHPLYLFLAIGFGATGFSWMNDSGFWVVSRLSGFSERETLRTWTPLLTIISITGIVLTLVASRVAPLAAVAR